MDTRVTEGQKWAKTAWFFRARMPHADARWWCVMLCVLVCGCDLLKPTASRQSAETPTAAKVAQSSDQVAAPAPQAVATAAPTGTTPQPPAVRTSITDAPPAPALSTRNLPPPALNPAPPVQPARSVQNGPGPSVSIKVQTSHTVTNSVANPPTPQTTVTYMPREAAAALVIKGPPRQPESRANRIAVPLCLGMGLGAALVALVLGAKRRFAVPSVRKAHRHDLFLPSEFKLKDSAIEPSAPFGMLAPEKRVRRSKMELLVSLLASTASAIRSLASKLPVERASNFCRSAWQRISAPPATPEQCSSEPLSPGAADSKCPEVPVVVESQHAPAEAAAKGTPVESHAFPPSANPVVPVSAPVEAPSLEAKSAEKSAEKVADQAVSTTTPGQRPIL